MLYRNIYKYEHGFYTVHGEKSIMNLKKYDIQIHLKNEKQIMSLLRLLILTGLLSCILFELLDYIWNIPVYMLCKMLFPWIVAIPAIVSYFKSGKSIKDLYAGNLLLQIVIGLGIGTAMAFAIFGLSLVIEELPTGKEYFRSGWHFLYYTARYFLVVGPSEEFIYRVGIQEKLEELFGRFKFLAPFFAALLFSLSHLISAGMLAVYISFIWGLIWGYTKLYLKNCTFLTVSLAHGMYDFFVTLIPYIIIADI